MVDRSFKICNNWNSFHNDIESVNSNLIKNVYAPFLIHIIIKKYLNYKFSSNQNQLKGTSDVTYLKLPDIGNLSHNVNNKVSKLCKEFCQENFKVMLAVVLPILAKPVVILKQGLRNTSKRIVTLMFLNIYTPPQHALTDIIIFLLK